METSGEFLGFLLAEGYFILGGFFHLYRDLQTYPGWLNLFFHYPKQNVCFYKKLNVSGIVAEDLIEEAQKD